MTYNDSNELERVNLAFNWTPEEFNAAYKEHTVRGARLVSPKIRWILLVIASLLYLILVGLRKGFSFDTSVYGICLLLVGSIFFLSSPWYQTRQFKRYRAALCGKSMQWDITPTELVNSLSDGTGATIHWDSITSARKGSNGILLYITPAMFYWFPYHAFKSAEDVNTLEKIVAMNVSNFRKVESRLPRIILGFLIAPMFAPIPTFFYGLRYTDLPNPAYFMNTVMTSLPIAYTVAVLFGAPIFLLLRKMSKFSLTSTLISGLFLGPLPLLILAPKAIIRLADEGKTSYLCVLAMDGLISALVFWKIVDIENSSKNTIIAKDS